MHLRITTAAIAAFAMLPASTMLFVPSVAAGGSFADQVVSYEPGTTAVAGFGTPAVALGSPERFTGEDVFPTVVSPFSPPFLSSELVSLGEGGHLTLRLSHFAVPQPGTPEIGLFTNAGLIDTDGDFSNMAATAGPSLSATSGTFGVDSALVEISRHGQSWFSLGSVVFDIPTSGYDMLSDPFSSVPGATLSDFGKPYTGTLSDFESLGYDPNIIGLLDGSGGGTWLDISGSGLAQVGYVRFSVADDGDPATALNFELDAVSIANGAEGVLVPEPSSFVLLALGGLGLLLWRSRRRRACLAAAALIFAIPASLPAGMVFDEDFATDPVSSGRATVQGPVGSAARFDYSAGQITAHYDAGQPTAMLVWPLGQSFSAGTDFRFEIDLSILADGYFADGNNPILAQIAFGLVNSATTGLDRLSDAYDIAGFDYFPAEHDLFAQPSIGPTVIGSNDGSGFFNLIEFPFGAESSLKDNSPGGDPEEALPLDTPLTAVLAYEAAARTATISIVGPQRSLYINQFGATDVLFTDDMGGPDDNITTIQHTLPPTAQFSVDSFGLTLWDIGASTTVADVRVRGLRVFDDVVGVPEPGTFGLLATGMLAICLFWRRRSGF